MEDDSSSNSICNNYNKVDAVIISGQRTAAYTKNLPVSSLAMKDASYCGVSFPSSGNHYKQ